MEDNKNKVLVGFGDSEPSIVFFFTCLVCCFMCLDLGIFGLEAVPVLGLFQIGISLPYANSALNLIHRGDECKGNAFSAFAGVFGAGNGLANVFSYFAALNGWPCSTAVFGVMWFWCAFLLLPLAIVASKGPIIGFAVFGCGVVCMLLMSVNTLFLNGALTSIIVVLEAIICFGGLWCWFNMLLAQAGLKPHFGPMMPSKK